MTIEIKIDDGAIQDVVDEAIVEAVRKVVVGSPVIKAAVEKAIATITINTKQIEDAITKAVSDVTSKPEFLNELIKKSILDSSNKLAGSFDASLKAAGKALALDRETIDIVTSGFKQKLLEEYEAKGMGAFS